MNTHSTSYYVIRSIVRFVFYTFLVAGTILLIHFIASFGLLVSLVFGGLIMVIYFALGRLSRRA